MRVAVIYVQCMIYFVAFVILTGTLWAEQPSALADIHQGKGLKCLSCHKEDPPKIKVPDSVCLDCHGDQGKVMQRTNKYDPNPHVSPHSTKLICGDCHHAHKPSEISCQVCHTNMEFKK